MGTDQKCTNTFLHEGSNMHKETLLHVGHFCTRVIKNTNYLKKKRETKRKLIQKLIKRKIISESRIRVRSYSDSKNKKKTKITNFI